MYKKFNSNTMSLVFSFAVNESHINKFNKDLIKTKNFKYFDFAPFKAFPINEEKEEDIDLNN
jgi:hypothetical protein